MENLKVTFPLVYNDRRSTLSIQPAAEQQDGYLKYTDDELLSACEKQEFWG